MVWQKTVSADGRTTAIAADNGGVWLGVTVDSGAPNWLFPGSLRRYDDQGVAKWTLNTFNGKPLYSMAGLLSIGDGSV